MKNLIPLFRKDKQAAIDAAFFHRELEIDVMARTLWGEARGEGSAGMQAVAAVILNRVRKARERGHMWWGNTIIDVCQKPYQFSCWNKDDPNYPKVLSVTDDDIHFVTARRLAQRACLGLLPDPVNGATHYHAVGILPYWAKNEKPVAVAGRHIFYRMEA